MREIPVQKCVQTPNTVPSVLVLVNTAEIEQIHVLIQPYLVENPRRFVEYLVNAVHTHVLVLLPRGLRGGYG